MVSIIFYVVCMSSDMFYMDLLNFLLVFYL